MPRFPWPIGDRSGGPLLGVGIGIDETITFYWNTEGGGALPGGAAFSRASIKQEFDGAVVTQLASGAIPENTAAVGGGAQGFHPEPAATNLMPTVVLTDAAWTENDIGVTSNGVNALGLTEYVLDDLLADSFHRVFDTATSSGVGSAYAIFAAGNHNFIAIQRGLAGTNDYAVWDLTLGTVTEEGNQADGNITDWGGGLYKCELNDQVSDLDFYSQNIVPTGTPGNITDNFQGANRTILSSHAQRENTPFSTSPIITPGGSRAADVLDMGVAVTTEFSALLDVTLPIVIGSGINITLLGPDATIVDILRVDNSFNVIMDDGVAPVTIGTSSAGARFKVAYGRDASGRSGSLNGATAVNGSAPGAGHVGENFELGSRVGVNQSRCIHHVSTLYNVKKSDAELEALAAP